MRTVLLLLSLLCLSAAFNLVQNAPAAIPWPFTVCGEGKWTIESLTLGAQPTKNSNNNIDISGTAQDDFTSTAADLTVKLNGVYLHSETIDFKQSYGAGDTVDFKYTSLVPGFSPSGTYTLIFNFKADKTPNGCMTFNFKLN